MRAGSPELIVVMGGGGHGRETVSLIQDADRAHPGRWELVGVVADGQPDVERLESLGVKWLGPIDGLQPGHACVSVAIGDGHQRARLQRHARGLGYRPATLVHPTAAIGLDVRMGDGCYVGCLTVLTSHVRLGEGVQVNVACSLSHDVTLGDFVTLSPGVRLAGGVVVGDESTIFTGATVLPGVRLGRDVTVGAGAVVVHDVPDGQTVFGVPARPTGGS